MLEGGKPFTKENLDAAYVSRRRASWLESESKVAEKARDGFQQGFLNGLIGMGLAGLSGGRLAMPGKPLAPHERLPSVEDYFAGRIDADEIGRIRAECNAKGKVLHIFRDAAPVTLCGRARVAALRYRSKTAHTDYLRLCPYCVAWGQGQTRHKEATF